MHLTKTCFILSVIHIGDVILEDLKKTLDAKYGV